MKAKRLNLCALGFLASLCLTLTVPVTLTSAQSSQAAETETGYVISLRGSTLTLSNIPMGSPQGNRGGGDEGPRFTMQTPDGGTREIRGKEAEQIMKRMRPGGGGTRIEVSEVNGKRTYTLTGPDGKSRTLTQEEFDKVRKKMESEGGGRTRIEISEVNGKRVYTVTGPDGKARELSQEEFEKFQKKMESEGGGHRGGRMMMRSTEDSQSPPAGFHASPAPAVSAASSGKQPGETKGEKKIERKQVHFSRFAVTDQTSKPDGLARGTKVKVHYRLEGGKKIATRVELLTD